MRLRSWGLGGLVGLALVGCGGGGGTTSVRGEERFVSCATANPGLYLVSLEVSPAEVTGTAQLLATEYAASVDSVTPEIRLFTARMGETDARRMSRDLRVREVSMDCAVGLAP